MADEIGGLRFSGVDNVVTTADHQPGHSYLRGFIPEIVSLGGGGITLSLLEEKYFQEHDQKGTAKLSTVDDDDVDTTLKLSAAVSRNSADKHDQKGTAKLSTVDDDDVDTTLKLSAAVSRNSADPVPVYNPMPLRSFPPGINNIPESDTWVGGRGSSYSRKKPFKGYDDNDFEISATDHVDTTLSLSPAGSRIYNSGEKRAKTAKRKQENVGDEKKRSSVKRKEDQ